MKAKPVDLCAVGAIAQAAGFGKPEWEHRFDKTRRWRFDLCWPEQRVAFERHGGTWQGGHHTRGAGFRDDREKMNAAQIAGWLVIEATADMIKSGLATDQLLAALAARAET